MERGKPNTQGFWKTQRRITQRVIKKNPKPVALGLPLHHSRSLVARQLGKFLAAKKDHGTGATKTFAPLLRKLCSI